MTAIEKYIKEYYPEYVNLGEKFDEQTLNVIHGSIHKLDNGEEWYIRFWSPTKKGGKSQLHYCKADLVKRVKQNVKL